MPAAMRMIPTMTPAFMLPPLLRIVGLKFRKAPREKAALRLLPRQRASALVRHARLGVAADPAAQVRSRAVRQRIVREAAPRQDRLDQRQPARRAVAHRNRRGATQLDDG